MSYTKKDFIEGITYKVKYEGEARASSREYVGTRQEWIENEAGEIVKGEILAWFNSPRGANKYYYFNEIVSAVEVAPKDPKKYEKTCDRCYGAGRFEHVKHVQGGICFKCEGRGKI